MKRLLLALLFGVMAYCVSGAPYVHAADAVIVSASANPQWPAGYALKAPPDVRGTDYVLICPAAVAPGKSVINVTCPSQQFAAYSSLTPTSAIALCFNATSDVRDCDPGQGGQEGWQVAALLWPAPVSTIPPPPPTYGCRYKYGTTPSFFTASDKDYAAAYFCPGPYDWGSTSVSGPLSEVPAMLADLIRASKSDADFDAVWAKYVRGVDTDPVRKDMRNALVAANRPPDPVWSVAKAAAITRPTFPVVSGIRSHTSNGRVITALTCGCKALAMVEGATTYCSVAGLANSGAAGVLPPGTVSVCARQ